MYTLYISQTSAAALKVAALLGYAGPGWRVCTQGLVGPLGHLGARDVRQHVETVPLLMGPEGLWRDPQAIAGHIASWSRRPLAPEPLPHGGDMALVAQLLEILGDVWMVPWAMLGRVLHAREACAQAATLAEEWGGAVAWELGALPGPARWWWARQWGPPGVVRANAQALAQSRARTLQALEALLGAGQAPFLLGPWPCRADFAFFGALVQLRRGPFGWALLQDFPGVWEYIGRLEAMLPPLAEVICPEQAPTPLRPPRALAPLLAEFMGALWPVLEALGTGGGAVRASLIDASSFACPPHPWWQQALGRLLAALASRARQAGGELWLPAELASVERALVAGLARLSRTGPGRAVLGAYPELVGAS